MLVTYVPGEKIVFRPCNWFAWRILDEKISFFHARFYWFVLQTNQWLSSYPSKKIKIWNILSGHTWTALCRPLILTELPKWRGAPQPCGLDGAHRNHRLVCQKILVITGKERNKKVVKNVIKLKINFLFKNLFVFACRRNIFLATGNVTRRKDGSNHCTFCNICINYCT